MRNLILSICVAICALFSVNNASAQTIPSSMLPEIVANMQKMCPQSVGEGMVMSNVYLQNADSEMMFEFKVNASELGFSSEELIDGFKKLTPQEKKECLGEEFAQVAAMLPVPVYASFKFADGKTFKMKLTD